MSYIRSKDAAIYYEEYGTGEPLILLPGLLGTIESHWRRFIPEFARHYHTIAVDLRGHGKTNNPLGELTLQLLVDDLHAVFDTLQIEYARICGYSEGGYIGLAYGVRYIGRVRSLVMHGTKFYWTDEAVRSATDDFDHEKIMRQEPNLGEKLQRDHSPANGEEGWKKLLAASCLFIASLHHHGLTEAGVRLAQFPVLVSLGDSDEMIPRSQGERLTAALPAGTLAILENTNHPMQTVQKTPFLNLVLPFLEGKSPHHQETKPSQEESPS